MQRFGGLLELVVEDANLPLAQVEGNDRWNGDQDAHGRRDQGLGNPGHYGRWPLGGGLSQIVEGLDDAQHGAEQADERRIVSQRAEDDEAALGGVALAQPMGEQGSLEAVGAQLLLGLGMADHPADRTLGRPAAAALASRNSRNRVGKQETGRLPVQEEVGDPIDDDGDGDDRACQQEVEYPLAAGQTHGLHEAGKVHLVDLAPGPFQRCCER